MSADEELSYASYCGDCGRLVAAIVDSPNRKKDVANHVAQSLRDGCRVERVTCEVVRTGDWGCTDDCPCGFCARKRARVKPDTGQLGMNV